ncbi:hypothetical protein ASG51_22105 [Methylobacterium sp. Leaf465]|uniref:hypothetical protein n=1 Tax=Methylobacterium sp. Leaf465 TaxID=1736385 RepID=UPI0006FFD204|nr:hypothetical protein [Methylobacterium sp. Leaf465]KQT78598.1 hypothetical protein ASG51_22105 [Methylobacterium sp. Leaf465]
MAARILDRDRFAKCRALMERGATPGERAAGRAAATRVAATAGLSLADALVLADAGRPDAGRAPAPDHDRPRRPAERTYAWATPRPAPEPVTVEELQRQKAADEARRKKATARARRRPQAADPDWEHWSGEVREAQAARDRDWAQRRPPRAAD